MTRPISDHGPALAAAPRVGGVPAELDDLRNAAGSLEAVVAELRDLLAPVCRDSEPRPPMPDDRPEPASTVANAIREIRTGIAESTRRLGDLVTRIDL